jgi:hypothetical protein
VNNPQEGKGAFSHKYKNEIHTGVSPKWGKYNRSFDGQSSCDADIERDKAAYSDADIYFFWTWQLNCHFNSRDITRKTKPSIELIKGLANLENPKGTTDLPQHFTWKAFAEQSDPKGDNRSNKCLCLAPVHYPELQLKRAGKVLARAPKYHEPYLDGRSRYYFSVWGYQVSKVPVELWGNGKLIGHVNPGFRDGDYH